MNIPPSPKDHNKTVIKANHRNYFRADTHSDRQSQSNNQSISSQPFRNISNQLHKGQNTRSNYLKRVKIESYRMLAENDQQFNHLEKLDFLASEEQNNKKQYPKYRKKSTQTNQRSFKSFIIRKKNASNYSRKQQQGLNKCQAQLKDIRNKVMLEVRNNSKDLCRKAYRQNSIQIIEMSVNSTQAKGTKPMSVHILRNNLNPGPNILKMKVLPCKQLKKTTKYFRGEVLNKETKRVPSIQKKADNLSTEAIQQIVKKVQIISNSSIQQEKDQKLDQNKSKANREIKKQKPKSFHSKQNGNKIERVIRGGCKTIRVPWQASGASFNEMKSRQTKKRETKMRNQWEDNKIEDEMFGGISMIPQKQSKKKLEETINAPQSLKQIFLQLNENNFDSNSLFQTREIFL